MQKKNKTNRKQRTDTPVQRIIMRRIHKGIWAQAFESCHSVGDSMHVEKLPQCCLSSLHKQHSSYSMDNFSHGNIKVFSNLPPAERLVPNLILSLVHRITLRIHRSITTRRDLHIRIPGMPLLSQKTFPQ